jgi:putative FmdB family regulatory protein
VPLYEYQCARCGRFEQIQKFSDPPLTACPTCGQEVHKLLSAPAIQFKGTGWYITDYARKSAGADGASKDAPKDAAPKEAASKDSSKDTSSTASSAGAAKDSSPSGSSSTK